MTLAIITFFIGIFLGVTISSLCVAASNRDNITYEEESAENVLPDRQI